MNVKGIVSHLRTYHWVSPGSVFHSAFARHLYLHWDPLLLASQPPGSSKQSHWCHLEENTLTFESWVELEQQFQSYSLSPKYMTWSQRSSVKGITKSIHKGHGQVEWMLATFRQRKPVKWMNWLMKLHVPFQHAMFAAHLMSIILAMHDSQVCKVKK